MKRPGPNGSAAGTFERFGVEASALRLKAAVIG
jgi:hypothetical protein